MIAGGAVNGARVARVMFSGSMNEGMTVPTGRLDVKEVSPVEDGIRTNLPGEVPDLPELTEYGVSPVVGAGRGCAVGQMNVSTPNESDHASPSSWVGGIMLRARHPRKSYAKNSWGGGSKETVTERILST